MIAYIKGKLEFIQEQSITVDVQGIGYEVFCANPYAFQNDLKENVFVYTYQHVREDAIILYGFKNEDEKYLFTKLISVSGIGPKSGIQILGGADVGEFVQAVEEENEKFLTQFPGVGKKTARQIILDLKGKLTTVFTIDSPIVTDETTKKATNYLDETAEALKALGYLDKEIKAILPELQKVPADSTDALIRKALSLLLK